MNNSADSMGVRRLLPLLLIALWMSLASSCGSGGSSQSDVTTPPNVTTAACTGSSPTWTSTPDVSSVNTCVTNAVDGDTINVSVGSATWSSGITVTKQVSIIGAGIGNTVLTKSGSGGFFGYGPGSNVALFRISGFTFIGNGNSPSISLSNSNSNPPLHMIRIDHNRFTSSPSKIAIENFGARGVIDNNLFDGLTFAMRIGWGDGGGQWNWDNLPELVFGAANDNMYAEDNTFTGLSTTTTDCGQGGRWVFRYNSFAAASGISPWLDIHNWQGPGDQACMGGEVYGNLYTTTGDRLLSHRGGRATGHHNQTVSGSGGWDHRYSGSVGCPTGFYTIELVNNSFYFLNRVGATGSLIRDMSTWAAPCGDGTNEVNWHTDSVAAFDGTLGVGAGTLAARPVTCTPGVGYWATDQSTTDLTGMVGLNPSTPVAGTFYQCGGYYTGTGGTPNTWVDIYTPLAYPHPLRN